MKRVLFWLAGGAFAWVMTPFSGSQVSAPASIVIAGTVCNANGKPVPSAEVHLEKAGDVDRIVRADGSGGFSFSAPGPGPYGIHAEMGGLRSESSAVSPKSAGEIDHIQLVLDQKSSPNGDEAGLSSGSAMEFADQPNFTVAGVTDWTAAGGHGSDTSLRTSESLTRETLTLKGNGGASSTDLDPDNLKSERDRLQKLNAQSESADLDRQLGDVDERLGDPLTAAREYERAVKLDPSEANYFAWGSELLLHRAVWQAAEVFSAGAKAYPKSSRMLAALGTALFSSARYEEAAARLCEAADLDPADVEPYLFLGKIELAAPSPLPCAEEKLARFAESAPKNAMAQYYYAMAIWKRQPQPANVEEMQKVEGLLGRAVSIDPKCADAYLQLGLLRYSRHEYDKAIENYLAAIAANPRLGEAHYRLGVAYDRVGAAEKAKQEFQLHDEIEKAEAEAVERQRREVKQFSVVQDKSAPVSQ